MRSRKTVSKVEETGEKCVREAQGREMGGQPVSAEKSGERESRALPYWELVQWSGGSRNKLRSDWRKEIKKT